MSESSQPIQKLSDLANILLEKLTASDQEVSLEFQDMTLQGPGPQGQQGQWKLNGKVSIKTNSSGTVKG